ncbi:MAG: 4Fe-4S dicluster domain-containing protein [bacterium]
MKWILNQDTCDQDFLTRIETMSGQRVSSCYQCGKCSAGCPLCTEMDLAPNQIIRLVQLGIKERVLASKTIWICASCQTCTLRCPQLIDLAKVMDGIRIIAQQECREDTTDWRRMVRDMWQRAKEGTLSLLQMDAEANLKCFNQIFLDSIQYYGRVFEPSLIYNYNINSGYLFANFLKAPIMLLKSKIKLLPVEVQRVERVQKIFERVRQLEREEE